jgi:integrase
MKCHQAYTSKGLSIMPRQPKPTAHQGFLQTRVGGSWHKLCPLSMGETKAQELLNDYVKGLKEERLKAQEEGILLADAPLTVPELAAKFLVHVEANNKPATQKWYNNYLRRLVLQFGGRELARESWEPDEIPERLIGGERPLPAKKLDLTHGNLYKKFLVEDCCLEAVTINHHLRSARVCLNWACKPSNRLIPFNPWIEVKDVPEEWRTRVVTGEEFEKLLGGVEDGNQPGSGEDFRDMLSMLRFTAMRPQELRVAGWDMVDYSKHLLVIPASLTKTFTTARNPQPRYVVLLPEAEDLLRKRQAKYGGHPRPGSPRKAV